MSPRHRGPARAEGNRAVTETAKIILTALATIFGGVLVYVAGQLLSKLFIEPVHEQRKVIGEIDVGLVLWAREWANLEDWPAGRTERRDKAQDAFREYASRLVASTNAIGRRFYGVGQRLGAPAPDDVRLSARDLVGLSNTMYSDAATRFDKEQFNRQRVENIRQHLGLWAHAGEEPIAGPGSRGGPKA